MNVLRVLEHVHGHLGWLAVAALLHPAILLRNPERRARLSTLGATLLTLITGGLGAYLYPDYRIRLKQQIFVHTPALGWCFERKEHLAVGALAFAIIGCIAHWSTQRIGDDALRTTVARGAHRAYVVAFALSFGVAIFGVAVAVTSTF